jgi:hypothetical protein
LEVRFAFGETGEGGGEGVLFPVGLGGLEGHGGTRGEEWDTDGADCTDFHG